MRCNTLSVFVLATALRLVAETPVPSAPAIAPVTEWKLPGKTIRDVAPDTVRTLDMLIQVKMDQAKRAAKVSPAVSQIYSFYSACLAKQDWNSAYRTAARLLIRLQGEDWSETNEAANSFDLRLSRLIYEPGEPIEAALAGIYDSGDPFPAKLRAQLSVRTAAGEDLAKTGMFKVGAFGDYPQVLKMKKKLEPGRYFVRYELVGPDGPLVDFQRPFLVANDASARAAKILAAAIDRQDLPAEKKLAVESLQYIGDLVRRSRADYVATGAGLITPFTSRIKGYDFAKMYSEVLRAEEDLSNAEEIVNALASAKPLANLRGDLHLAYRAADGNLVPFRVYVPESYKATKPLPLAVFLHDSSADENVFFDRFSFDMGHSILKRNADRFGYILMSPSGRSAFADWTNSSEQDVLDTVERVKKLYAVSMIFLGGHAHGAVGVWNIGLRHPKMFAGLVAAAGTVRLDENMLIRVPDLPVAFMMGAKDDVIAPDVVRQTIKVGGEFLNQFMYQESPDADHWGVIDLSITTSIFEFLQRVRNSHGA